LCVICHERPDELRDALASVSGEDFDEVVVLDMASDPPLEPMTGTKWLRSEVNLGVTSGRNQLVEATSSDLLVFLDDDAVFRSPVVAPLRERFAADPKLAVVAFRIERATGPRVSLEYPFRGKSREDAEARACTYFLGGACAVRRQAWVEAGGYDEGLFYSTEEVDLGFRLIRSGWRLLYDPAIVVEHRPSLKGRSVAPRVPALRLRNRLILVRRYLPAPVAAFHGAAWGARTLLEAARLGVPGVTAWLRAWGDGLRQPVDRRPLSWRALLEAHRLGGRVLW
jgi:GT2 family glycosyltransferase